MFIGYVHISNQLKYLLMWCISVIRSNSRRFAAMSESLNKVPVVDIDGHGKFKYILINVHDETSKDSKSIVRGYARASWHGESIKYNSLINVCFYYILSFILINI